MAHLPLMWRTKLLAAINAPNNTQNRLLLRAWAKAEGGSAKNNPLNTTQPEQGSTPYNSSLVQSYPSGAVGIAATATTLKNGFYNGILADMRSGKYTARQIVLRNEAEFKVWGTGATLILEVLASL